MFFSSLVLLHVSKSEELQDQCVAHLASLHPHRTECWIGEARPSHLRPSHCLRRKVLKKKWPEALSCLTCPWRQAQLKPPCLSRDMFTPPVPFKGRGPQVSQADHIRKRTGITYPPLNLSVLQDQWLPAASRCGVLWITAPAAIARQLGIRAGPCTCQECWLTRGTPWAVPGTPQTVSVRGDNGLRAAGVQEPAWPHQRQRDWWRSPGSPSLASCQPDKWGCDRGWGGRELPAALAATRGAPAPHTWRSWWPGRHSSCVWCVHHQMGQFLHTAESIETHRVCTRVVVWAHRPARL